MTVLNIMERLNLSIAAGAKGLEKEVNGVYVCDLLSWVMSHASPQNAWITIQTHPNVVAVASLLEISCIIVPENTDIDNETIKQADNEGIPLLKSSDNGYQICTQIYKIFQESQHEIGC